MSDLTPRSFTIAVGVSGTSGSPDALRWAVEEARLRSARLLAVTAWRPPRPPMTSGARMPAVLEDADAAFAAAAARLREAVAAAAPDAACATEVVQGGKLRVLLDASARADLLVLDAPRRTRLSQSPLVAQRLVYRAACPVVIMPPTA